MIWLIKSVASGVIVCLIVFFGLLVLSRLKPNLFRNEKARLVDVYEWGNQKVSEQDNKRPDGATRRCQCPKTVDDLSHNIPMILPDCVSKLTEPSSQVLWELELDRLQGLYRSLQADRKTGK